jgi:two-component system NarL family sensor kinase
MVDCIRAQGQSTEWKERAAEEASTLIDQAIQQVRSISHLLHPPMLDEVGLQSSLQWYLDGLTKRSGLETSLDMQPKDFPRLGPELETTIFRIVQEALTNVYRHAEARKASISLTMKENQIAVTVQDDGKGIPDVIGDFKPDKIGVGIAGMRQRVKEFGGELRLRNGTPGTCVEVVIPIKSAAPRSQAGQFTASWGGSR